MSRFGTLLRAGLKSNFGLAVLWHRLVRERKDLWMLFVLPLALIGLGPMIYYYVLFLDKLHVWLSGVGQAGALLTFGFLLGQLFVLVFGLYYVISAFYFSRDLEFLVPLPLRPSQIMLSKFVIVLINEYLTVAIIVLPALVVYGLRSRASALYWLEAGLAYLLLPVIPLAAVSLLVVVLMRFVNLGRRKDALVIVGSLILISGALLLQVWAGKAPRTGPDPSAVVTFLTSPDSLPSRIGARFPPSVWATRALAAGAEGRLAWPLLFYVGGSLLLLAGFVVAAQALFYRGLIGLGEISRRGKALSRADMARRLSSGRRPVRTIFVREWRIMNRTPIFLLNGVLTVVLLPVIFFLMSKADAGSSDATSILRVLSGANPFVTMLGAAGFMTICGSLNGTSSSTFSREGARFWISKVIPVAPRDQVAGKLLHSFLIALLGIVAAAVLLLWQFRIKAAVFAAALPLALLASFLLTVAGMAIDLARPLLDWTNPQKAIKQNLNVLLAFGADIGILTGLTFLTLALGAAGASKGVRYAILAGLLAGLCAAAYAGLVRLADKRYPAIET